MKLQIVDFHLGGHPVEAYYYTDGVKVSGVAIQPDLPPFAKRGRIVEAEAYHKRKPPVGGRKFCMSCEDVAQLDRGAVNALRSIIDDHKPGWVYEVKDASRISNDPRVIAAWCELSLQVVVAILENLQARGELEDQY